MATLHLKSCKAKISNYSLVKGTKENISGSPFIPPTSVYLVYVILFQIQFIVCISLFFFLLTLARSSITTIPILTPTLITTFSLFYSPSALDLSQLRSSFITVFLFTLRSMYHCAVVSNSSYIFLYAIITGVKCFAES